MGNSNLNMNIINIMVLVLGVILVKGDKQESIQDIVKEMVEMEMRETNTKIATLEQEMKSKEECIKELERDVKFLKDSPYSYYSSYKSYTGISSGTVSYSSLLHSSTNVESDMDTETGIFTSGSGGTYTVSWSLWAQDDTGGYHPVEIYLRRNGTKITESYHHSYYFDASGGTLHDQGGRNQLLHLDSGDTLDLWCENCSAGVHDIIFNVALSNFDIL